MRVVGSAAENAALLKLWALEAGFDRAGVANLERSAYQGSFLQWIDLGRQAGMEYLERRVECRLDPQTLVPGARSVLCVALQYASSHDDVEGDLWPRVARYARGDDYHDLFERRMKALLDRIEEAFPIGGGRFYVDTGPVLERELAERAGLGAFGKNTNLLHPESGSYFLLGEVFLDLELEADTPIADLCGSCTACLEACPTQALVAPYVLDSRRCISYWNIEHRGAIPEQDRALLGEWVFGCDICQEVCPWNAEPEPAPGPEFDLPPRRRSLGLIDLLALDRKAYVERFRRSPMKRAKLEGLKRNAAIAMGNGGRELYVEALAEALGKEGAMVRGHAAWALGQIGGERAVDALRASLEVEAEGTVLTEIRSALDTCQGAFGGSESG